MALLRSIRRSWVAYDNSTTYDFYRYVYDTLIRKKKYSKYSRIRKRIRCFTALLLSLAISYYISHAREIIDREKTVVKYGEGVEEKKIKKNEKQKKISY